MNLVLRLLLVALALISSLRAVPWPEAKSDLPAHSGLHSGTLANGLRHLTFANAEPRDRISLRLVIAAGSVHEADDEGGLAHFVEHMAFRSTRTHPAGSLVAALQRLGLGLGPDNTAFTFFDHTVFHLELPDSTEATLREGLRVFREYAEELTFEPALIERERGVILSEKAARDSPTARSIDANLAFLFEDSRQGRRSPIGSAESIRALKREQFTAFYDAWYRPERMAVVAVGAVSADVIARLVDEELGGLRARGAPRPEPTGVTPARASDPDVLIFSDPGLVGVGLTLQHPIATPHAPDTAARRAAALHESLAFAALASRLHQIASAPETSFVAPVTGIGASLPGWRAASIAVSGKLDDWRKVARDIEREHRRAFLHGFTASEIAEARANFTNGLDQTIRSMSGALSTGLANNIAGSLVIGQVLVSPETYRDAIASDLAAATAGDLLRAFRAAWTAAPPHVLVLAHPALRITRHEFADVLNASREQPVSPRDDAPAPPFAYTHFGPPGRIVREEHIPDLDVRLAVFDNGVRCNFKTTLFEPDVVEIRIRVGEGRLSLPRGQPGLDLFATASFLAGGLGHHPAAELVRISAGRSLGYSFQIGHDAALFTARCARRDLLLCLQLLTAHLTDAAYRPESLRPASAYLGSTFAALAASPSGPIMTLAPRFLLRGDTRFGPPLPAEAHARTLRELRAWLDPQLKRGAIELSVVGDVTWEETTTALAATVGALSARGSRANTRATVATVKFASPPAAPHLIPIDPKLSRAAISCQWPVPVVRDYLEERRCRLLSQVLGDRLRLRLRDELGAVYTPSAGFAMTPGFPQVNTFSLHAEVEPHRIQQVVQIIEREVASLAAKGPNRDEFLRVRQPFLQQMAQDRRTNLYWGATVLSDAQLTPARLAAARDRAMDAAAITREDLAALAKRHFAAKKMFTFIGVPLVAAGGKVAPGR